MLKGSKSWNISESILESGVANDLDFPSIPRLGKHINLLLPFLQMIYQAVRISSLSLPSIH